MPEDTTNRRGQGGTSENERPSRVGGAAALEICVASSVSFRGRL